MTASHGELENLRMELQNLMVKFGLRALKLYQTGANEPLLPELKAIIGDNGLVSISEVYVL